MNRRLLATLCTFAFVSLGVAQVNVKVSAPGTNATVTSPIPFAASASSSHPIDGWQVYLDNADVYTGSATSSISSSLKASNGTHQLVVRAWDSTGAFGTQSLQVTVSGAATTPSSTPISVSVSAPVAYSSSTSPIHLHATAASSYAVTGWQVYLDNNIVYTGPASATIDTNVNASQGTHQLVVRAWDTSGAFGSQVLPATVTGAAATPPPPTTALPTPPSNAKVYSDIDQSTSGWANCHTAACAGGSGSGAFWQAFNQGSPSMDGRSMELYQDGKWSNALWYHKVGADDAATNLLWDFYVQLDSASVNAAQALEYDAFQFVAGYNYMIGTQCNYGAGVWDTWNEANGQWLHTAIPCKKFSPGAWHHIQWYMTTNHSNHTYTYKTLVVDGVVYNLNQTQPAKYLAWGSNVGVQWQMDVNASGSGYHEWVDKATLTIW
jgi:hypothetical protein